MMRKLFYLLPVYLLSLAIPDASAQQIFTNKGTINMDKQNAGQYRQKGSMDADAKPKRYILLSFDKILDQEQRQAIEATGITLKDWYPGNHYVARVNDLNRSLDALMQLGKRVPLLAINDLPAALKISTSLPGSARGEENFRDSIVVSVFDTADLPLLSSYLKQAGISYRSETSVDHNSLLIPEIRTAQIHTLGGLSFVSSIEPYAGSPKEEWTSKSLSNQVFAVNYNYESGAIGNGVYFGNFESFGLDTKYRLNMQGRQHPRYYGNTNNGHGTSVAAIIGTAANYDELNDRGMAPGIVSFYAGDYLSAENFYTKDGLRPLVTNHSVGFGEGQSTYNNESANLDRITRNLGGYLHGYSAGNSGGAGPYHGYPKGWANITGNRKVNKNNLTVHSSHRPGDQLDWTSKGPTADGRLKPDICAEGAEGSSFASPGAMGLAAILFEAYNTAYGTTIPRSDVVKAVMLNTAYDVDKKGIDFKTGFGIVGPGRAKKTIDEKRIITGTMPMGTTGNAQYTLKVPAGTSEAKFMLYWHDYPGANGAAKALVNDLDLYLISPSGDTVRPWVLNPTPATVYDLPQRKTDTLNNVEQVTIDNPVAGDYTVYIKGSKVPQGPQNYVLTWDMLPYHIKITCPVAGYRLPQSAALWITWDISNNTGVPADSLDLYLQRSSSEPFIRVTTIPYDKRFFSYTIPAAFPNSATARVVVKQRNHPVADTSKYFHVLTRPTNLAITNICADKISLKWDTLTGNSGGKYIIYRLGQKYMEPVDSVAHPSGRITLTASRVLGAGKTWNKPEYFAVATRHHSGALSVRSLPVSSALTDPLSPTPNVAGSFTLCYNDTAMLSINKELEPDSIQWFRMGDSTKVLSRARVFPVTRTDTGTFYFKTYSLGCSNKGPSYAVKAEAVNIADTALWGNSVWLVSAYNSANPASTPYYGAHPKYYGKFRIDSLSFNSNNYYAYSGSGPHNAPGYQGCAFKAAGDAVTVYKRKGFTPGKYQIDLQRASGRLKMTINNGKTTNYTSASNASNVNNIWTGMLDSNSTIRIEAYGSHTMLRFIRSAVPLPVDLLRFDAGKLPDNTVALDFTFNTTAPYLELRALHSTDARSFDRVVGRIQLQEGTSAYRLLDNYPVTGTNYYRLTWSEGNDYKQYSPIKQVIVSGHNELRVYPTLSADGNINVQMSNTWASAEIKVSNISGQKVNALISGTAQHKVIALAGLAPGVYFIELSSQEQRQVFKVVYHP